MFKKKLCPHCQNGKHTYELDSRSSECPYIAFNNGRECIMYKKAKDEKKQSISERIAEKLSRKGK